MKHLIFEEQVQPLKCVKSWISIINAGPACSSKAHCPKITLLLLSDNHQVTGPATEARAACLRVAVLSALQAVEYGTQSAIAGGLVLFHGTGFAGEFCYPAGKAGASLDG